MSATGQENGRSWSKSGVEAAATFHGYHDSTEGGRHSALEKLVGPERISVALRSHQEKDASVRRQHGAFTRPEVRLCRQPDGKMAEIRGNPASQQPPLFAPSAYQPTAADVRRNRRQVGWRCSRQLRQTDREIRQGTRRDEIGHAGVTVLPTDCDITNAARGRSCPRSGRGWTACRHIPVRWRFLLIGR